MDTTDSTAYKSGCLLLGKDMDSFIHEVVIHEYTHPAFIEYLLCTRSQQPKYKTTSGYPWEDAKSALYWGKNVPGDR